MITVYPKKYAHGFVVLCFVVVMQSFIKNSHEVFIHIHQGCFAGTGAIVRLPQCQWSNPDGYGKISQCITTTKHSKAKTVCIFLGIYCTYTIGSYHTPFVLNQNCIGQWYDNKSMKITKLGSYMYVKCSTNRYICIKFESWSVKNGPVNMKTIQIKVKPIYTARPSPMCGCIIITSWPLLLKSSSGECYWASLDSRNIIAEYWCKRFELVVGQSSMLITPNLNSWSSLLEENKHQPNPNIKAAPYLKL